MNPIYMLLAIPGFFICIMIEWLYGKWKGKKYYRFNDAITNLNIGIGSQIFGLLTKGLVVGSFLWIAEHWGIFNIPVNFFSWMACMILFDFLYYWAHRWSHEVNFLWGAHIVHHSSEDYNLSVALRQSWIHGTIAVFVFLPVPFLGFAPEVFLSVAGFVTLYQFWIHTEAVERLPKWFEYIFNSPTHHRVHHSSDPKYIDKNYAATFIFWDRIFGTYMEEDEKPSYGITSNLNSWNPIWANLHYYVDMWKLSTQLKFTDKVKLIFARPGWKSDMLSKPSRNQQNMDEYGKYDNKNPHMNIYIMIQFVLITLGLLAYMYHFANLTIFFKWTFAALMILSILVLSALLESKK